MKESYECDVATHIGPESCGAAREGGVEALTRERAGRVFSRVRTFLRDADAVRRCGRPHSVHRMGPSASPYGVGVPEEGSYAAEYPARTFPCQRFDAALASGSA